MPQSAIYSFSPQDLETNMLYEDFALLKALLKPNNETCHSYAHTFGRKIAGKDNQIDHYVDLICGEIT